MFVRVLVLVLAPLFLSTISVAGEHDITADRINRGLAGAIGKANTGVPNNIRVDEAFLETALQGEISPEEIELYLKSSGYLAGTTPNGEVQSGNRKKPRADSPINTLMEGANSAALEASTVNEDPLAPGLLPGKAKLPEEFDLFELEREEPNGRASDELTRDSSRSPKKGTGELAGNMMSGFNAGIREGMSKPEGLPSKPEAGRGKSQGGRVTRSATRNNNPVQAEAVRQGRVNRAWESLNQFEAALDRAPASGASAAVREKAKAVVNRLRRNVIRQSTAGKKVESQLRQKLSQMQAHRKAKVASDSTPSGGGSGSVTNGGRPGPGAGIGSGEAQSLSPSLKPAPLSALVPPQLAAEVRTILQQSPNGEVAQLLQSLGVEAWPDGVPGPAEFLPGIEKDRPNTATEFEGVSAGGNSESQAVGGGGSDFDWLQTSLSRSLRGFLTKLRAKTRSKGGAIESETTSPKELDPVEALLARGRENAEQLDQLMLGGRRPESQGGAAMGMALSRENVLPLAYLAVLVLAAGATGLWVAWVLGALGMGFFPPSFRARLVEGLPWLFWRRRKKKKQGRSDLTPSSSS